MDEAGRSANDSAQGAPAGHDDASMWHFVDDWPQLQAHLRRTLDADLIPRHAVAVLRRALDFDRVIGFVGSGVSMAYGRLGWGELVKWMAAGATSGGSQAFEFAGLKPIDALREVPGRPAGSVVRKPTANEERIRKLLEQLSIHSRDVDDDLQSGRYPAAFQFLEQCADHFQAFDDGGHLRPESTVRLWLRSLLRDDGGHAYLLFERLLRDLLAKDPPDAKDANAPATRPETTWPALATFWTSIRRHLDELPVDGATRPEARLAARGQVTPDAWRSAFEIDQAGADGFVASIPAGVARSFCQAVLAALSRGGLASLPPPHRFAILALARLDPQAACATLWASPPAAPLRTRHQRARAQPDGRDPLRILLRDLGLSRYATTNYDIDLERVVFDAGFDTTGPERIRARREPAPGRTLARNALGMAAHDIVFRQSQAADLLRFAAGRRSVIQVVHLHGRVFPREPLVVTEDDYQSMYMRRSDEAEAAADAIALTFRSQTVLFVGSGMNEDDVLRPMRQFVTERRSSVERSGVVLLPADGSRARELDEIIALYSRYGVLTKHFGLGETGEGRTPVRWLERWLLLCRHLERTLKEIAAPAASVGAMEGSRTRFFKASDSLTSAEPWLPESINGVPADLLVRSMGLGDRFGDLPEFAITRAIAVATCALLDAGCRPTPPPPRPDWFKALGRTGRVARQGQDADAVRAAAAAQPPRGDASRRLVLALRAMLDGLGSALRGVAMNLELASLHQGWLRWKLGRRQSPAIRPVGAQRRMLVLQDPGKHPQVTNCHIFARNLLALRRPAGKPSAADKGLTPVTDRFMLSAPSHSFDKFIDALATPDRAYVQPGALPSGPEHAQRRRMFLLLARRGLGKGHFFEMMAEDERVAEFVRASWSPREGSAAPPEMPAYALTCYVNLGVSLEFLSAFDRLSLVLVDLAAKVFPDEPQDPQRNVVWQIERAAAKLARNRLARLKAILRLYAENSTRARKRVLIAFNGFGQFFDRMGAPKNAQLHRLVDALLGPEGAAVPIDVLMVCQDGDIPAYFRREGLQLPIVANRELDGWSHQRIGPLTHLVEAHPDERIRRKLDQTIEALHLSTNPRYTGSGAWLHVLRGAHASATVGKYFPDVALAIALRALAPAGAPCPMTLRCTPEELRVLQDALLYQLSKQKRNTESPERLDLPAVTLKLLACLVPAPNAPHWAGPRRETLKSLIIGALKQLEPGAKEGRRDLGVIVGRLLHAVLRAEPGAALSRRAAADSVAIDERFHRLHRAVKANRYLLTIGCAAAAERGWREEDKPGGPWHFEASAVVDWLDSVDLEVSNHLQSEAIDRIIARVLASHQHQHDQGRVPFAWGLLLGDAAGQGRVSITEPIWTLTGHLWPLRGEACKVQSEQELAGRLRAALVGPLGWRLQQRLLWHMAVMALEVQADVLASAPLVEADCALLAAAALAQEVCIVDLREHGVSLGLVQQMLDLLVHRCLVFRMQPVELGPDEVRHRALARSLDFDTWFAHQAASLDASDRGESSEPRVATGWRYTIHRFLQRTILEQLKAPFIEFPKVDQFGLSLWSTQPDDLPRPSRSTAHEVSDLVAAWIGFPKDSAAMNRPSSYHWFRRRADAAAKTLLGSGSTADWVRPELWREATLPSRMLRAALGVLRATYSVGVVSRFHDFDDDGTGLPAPEEGYFKQHHLQVRWMLEQARRLRGPDERFPKLAELHRRLEDDRAPKAPLPCWGLAMEAVAPFYVDELVWLNNECGLFCLVEGRLDNAAGMFRQALVAAEEVEGRDPHGALWCRVHMNLAIVDIERGHIREADERLAVIESVADENPILRILARGFRAVVEHLSGNLDHAETTYERVIADLVELGQLRSVAIFSRHMAELQRLKGASAAVKAHHAIEQSLAAATRGGHEDIRHLAMLSRVRLAIAGILPPEVLTRERDSIQTDLDAIDHYGHVMGMPRLLADVAFARALYLLNLGETRHAARLVHRCLEICLANGLRLRQMMALALLGRVYRRRGLSHLADPVFAHAYSIAVDCHYGNLREVASQAAAGQAGGL